MSVKPDEPIETMSGAMNYARDGWRHIGASMQCLKALRDAIDRDGADIEYVRSVLDIYRDMIDEGLKWSLHD